MKEIAIRISVERHGFEMSNFNEQLYEANSFIYHIAGKYYCIGANTFVELTKEEETDLYDLLENAIKKNNERQIAKYVEKMVRVTSTHRTDSKEHLRTKERLFEFLTQLSIENELEYQALQKQFLEYQELFAKFHKDHE